MTGTAGPFQLARSRSLYLLYGQCSSLQGQFSKLSGKGREQVFMSTQHSDEWSRMPGQAGKAHPSLEEIGKVPLFAQGYFCLSEIIPSRFGELYGMPEMKLRSATCKANTLPAVLSVRPPCAPPPFGRRNALCHLTWQPDLIADLPIFQGLNQ